MTGKDQIKQLKPASKLYYRLHHDRVDEEEFVAGAQTWRWDLDDEMRLYEKQVEGYYSACDNPAELLSYIGDYAADDEPVAVFEGLEADYTPETDCPGEVWVQPTRLVRWLTIAELKQLKEG